MFSRNKTESDITFSFEHAQGVDTVTQTVYTANTGDGRVSVISIS
jgi:nitrogen regulatory protein PII